MERAATHKPTSTIRRSRFSAVVFANVVLCWIWGTCGAEIPGQELSSAPSPRRGANASSSLRGIPVQFRAVSHDEKGSEHPRSTAVKKEAPPLPLAPPRRANSGDRENSVTSSPGRSSITTFASLCLIVGCACAVLWFARRGAPVHRGRLPHEVFESLGKAQLSPRLEVHLLRVGGKLVLVGSSASAANPLLEISDAAEVEKIVAVCVPGSASSVAASMRQAFSRLDAESPAAVPPAPRPRRYSPEVADV